MAVVGTPPGEGILERVVLREVGKRRDLHNLEQSAVLACGWICVQGCNKGVWQGGTAKDQGTAQEGKCESVEQLLYPRLPERKENTIW